MMSGLFEVLFIFIFVFSCFYILEEPNTFLGI